MNTGFFEASLLRVALPLALVVTYRALADAEDCHDFGVEFAFAQKHVQDHEFLLHIQCDLMGILLNP